MTLSIIKTIFVHSFGISFEKGEMMMSKSNLIQYVEFLLSNQDVKYPKPHPEIYLTAISKLGLQPKECLIVEDNFNGIKAAKDSGGNVYEVETIKGLGNIFLGGEGLFLTRLVGPGKVILQSQNFGDFANKLIPYMPKPSGN